MAIKVIARLTFYEASRRKVLLAALILGLLFLAIYGLGGYFIQREIVQEGMVNTPSVSEPIYSFILMSGLYVVNFMFVMMTVLTSVGTISGEIVSGTIHTLVTKPVRRWEIVVGKWLGLATMLTLYLLLMAGGVVGLTYAFTDYVAPNVLHGLALMWLNGLLLVNVTLWGSTWLSPLANGVLVFALYGIAFVGGWVEQIGALVNNQSAVNVGIISSLLLPSDALWKRAAFEMREPLSNPLGSMFFSSNTSIPSPLMIDYVVLYTVIALLWAVRIFDKRDL